MLPLYLITSLGGTPAAAAAGAATLDVYMYIGGSSVRTAFLYMYSRPGRQSCQLVPYPVRFFFEKDEVHPLN